jgi:voltage-gated potassium channel
MNYDQLKNAVFLFIGVIAIGTGGYALIEHMTVYDAFYMTIITISTVGFGEITPLSPFGRALTIFIIITGIGLGTYTLGLLVKILIEGEILRLLGRRKLKKEISGLTDHYIICGFGRIGGIICEELSAAGDRFVVIEKDPDKAPELEGKGFLYLSMDATTEDALIHAGIERAKGIVTAVKSDANNVFISLTAKDIRPDIFVLSRASDANNERKLLKAGATRVVSPYLIGGRRMAQVLQRPAVIDFIDTAMMSSSLNLSIQEVLLSPDSPVSEKKLIDSNLRRDFGVMIVAIKRSRGEMVFNPKPNERLEAGDTLIAIGTREEMDRLRCEIEQCGPGSRF